MLRFIFIVFSFSLKKSFYQWSINKKIPSPIAEKDNKHTYPYNSSPP